MHHDDEGHRRINLGLSHNIHHADDMDYEADSLINIRAYGNLGPRGSLSRGLQTKKRDREMINLQKQTIRTSPPH